MTLISAMCRPALDRRRSQPTLEVLEDRNLLSAGISGLSASHMVTITGTDLAETATVRYDNRGTASYLDDRVVVTMSNEIRTWEKAFTAWRFTSTSSGQSTVAPPPSSAAIFDAASSVSRRFSPNSANRTTISTTTATTAIPICLKLTPIPSARLAGNLSLPSAD